jgi:DNA-binding CsgD family transcriptional regulator
LSELKFIEACYAPQPSLPAWLRSMAELGRDVYPRSVACFVYPFTVTPENRVDVPIIVADDRGEARMRTEHPNHSPADWIDQINRSPIAEQVVGRIFCSPVPRVRIPSDFSSRVRATIYEPIPPQHDTLGLFGTLDGRDGVAVTTADPGRNELTARQRARGDRLSEHLAVGYRLQGIAESARLARAAAVATPDGRLLHLEPDARSSSFRASFVAAIRGLERARCVRTKRSPEEASQLWNALVGREYTTVEHVEADGRCLILAVRVRAPQRQLSARELGVVAGAADGLGNKAIAAVLGISAATVGVHLSFARRKLGLPTRQALILWYRRMRAIHHEA